jgi:Ca-activated chloride channel homolog
LSGKKKMARGIHIRHWTVNAVRVGVLMMLAVAAQAQAPTYPPMSAPPPPEPTQAPEPLYIPPPQANPQSPEKDDGGMFVMHKRVDEVALHASVIDDNARIVTDLGEAAFTVFEDGQPQPMTSFRREDIPVSMGILIDNSGSMREKRARVEQAALNLVKASNPEDEVMVVNFNEEGILDQDFTSDIGKLKLAMEKHEAQGTTALYDAVDGASAHLIGSSTHEKKVIFVVTDGEDNASRDTLEKVLQSLSQEGAPAVYAIGLLGDSQKGDLKQDHARHELRLLAERTGGIAFFARSLDEVDEFSRTVARDIRTQYAIGYKPTRPRNQGGYRTIRVEAHASGYRNLAVRTKRGYDAAQSPNQPLAER